MILKYAILVQIALLAGCASTAGPFVTNVSMDKKGNLQIEKCMVSLNRWINTIDNEDCKSYSLREK